MDKHWTPERRLEIIAAISAHMSERAKRGMSPSGTSPNAETIFSFATASEGFLNLQSDAIAEFMQKPPTQQAVKAMTDQQAMIEAAHGPCPKCNIGMAAKMRMRNNRIQVYGVCAVHGEAKS